MIFTIFFEQNRNGLKTPFFQGLRPYSKGKLELNSKKSNLVDAKTSSVFISFFFALKAGLQIFKFEFCQSQNKLGEQWINLQLTDKISLQLNSNSSLLLEYIRSWYNSHPWRARCCALTRRFTMIGTGLMASNKPN